MTTKNTCNCKEMSCQMGCTEKHTHKGWFCQVCRPTARLQVKRPATKNTMEGWEERFDEKFMPKFPHSGFESIVGLTANMHTVKSFIRTEIDFALKEQRKEYKEIFEWLLGERGKFPDLSKPPHYMFRKKLRAMLSNLTPKK